MKTRTSLIAATLATLIAGNAFANTHGEDAVTTMTVDSTAPIHATLLPTVSIDATSATSELNPARMRVAETEPVEVTLLPTVRVTAILAREVAMIVLPTVRVTPYSAAIADADSVVEASGFATKLPAIEDDTPAAFAQPFGLRAHTMPR
jgi:hypothetical protein